MVGVNSVAISTPETPFGGIKDSATATKGGIEGLEGLHEQEVHRAGVSFALVSGRNATRSVALPTRDRRKHRALDGPGSASHRFALRRVRDTSET
jgi:hypothetical protein